MQVESFTHIDEAVARLQDPASDFDVVFPVIDVLPGLVDAGLLRPLNHDYLPHVRNLWGWFRDGGGPFYDPGQRYTTPYTVYTGGIGWRSDLVAEADAPDRRDDPFDVFLDARYRDRVGIYDAYRDALALGLQRAGVTDLRAATDAELAAAADFLSASVAATNARFTDDGAEEGLPEGTFAVHQAWSGDILTAPRYAAEEGDDPREVAATLRYWSPTGPERVVGLDLTADLRARAQSRGRPRVPRSPAAVRRRAGQLRLERLPGADGRRHRRGVRRPVVPVARRRARQPPLAPSCRRRRSPRGRCWWGSGLRRTRAGCAQWSTVEPA